MSLQRVGPERTIGRGARGAYGGGAAAQRLPRTPASVEARVEESRAVARLELGLSLSGVLLAAFMVSHMGLLFSVLVGAGALDTVAEFMEKYYLLHAVVPPLVILILAHIYLAARKVPTAFPQQRALMRHMRSLGHFDTWAWAVQIVTGVGLLVLIAIHLWVVVSDLPIASAKSGARVFGVYLWFYIPYIVLVETHMSVGLYRVAVKWGLLARGWAHTVLTAWTVAVLSLGAAILVALYRIGGDL